MSSAHALDRTTIEACAEALKQRFAGVVEANGGKVGGRDGVTVPADDIWQSYAETVLAALPASPGGWMDIETADRDSEYRCLIAYRAAGGPRTTEAERVRGGWNTRNGAGFLCDGSPDLLGWMPLPTPPKEGPET